MNTWHQGFAIFATDEHGVSTGRRFMFDPPLNDSPFGCSPLFLARADAEAVALFVGIPLTGVQASQQLSTLPHYHSLKGTPCEPSK